MKVIDDGALRGFVPADRTWSGFSSEDFKVASQSVYGGEENNEDSSSSNESVLSNFQVVRAQLFSTRLYPAVTISKGKVRFNTACLKRFEDVEYVELLFNSVEKCLAVRPCEKSNPNAIQWGTLKEGKWIVKEKSCRGFSAPLYETMGWNEELRYRMRGSFMGDGDNKIMIFDLEEPEIIERVLVEDIPTQPDEPETEERKPEYKNVMTFNSHGVFGHSYDEDTHFLERVHYAGNWDVLRPAREVFGINPITESEIIALLQEAERIIDKLRVKRARVRIYRDVFRALGEPGCFRFLIDEETNRLAMQVCSFGDAGFHVAPDYYDKDPGWSFEITSLELLELIWEQCDWDPEGAYRITGILCRDINVVMFELNDAEKYSGVEFAMA